MPANVIEQRNAAASAAYDTDFYKWTEDMAQRLRARDVSALDWDNIAEEIGSMGRRIYKVLGKRTVVLLVHLLRWQLQMDHRSGSWRSTIAEQRRRIEEILTENPSLRPRIADGMEELYRRAALKATIATGLPRKWFPAECPWTFGTALGEQLEI